MNTNLLNFARKMFGLLAFTFVASETMAQDDFPIVPDDIAVSLYARDPLVRNPCGIAFDAKGRLCVGMGPQYRKPNPNTPGDSVFILIDDDMDGTVDRRKEFATGFNSIQSIAWKGNELWVANAPDLTVVRDLDGNDEADEYVRLYTDLGNLEHGLHGLNWGPDGMLYMSKGNSKGLTDPPDRVAPKPFRELWGVTAPEGTVDFPEPVVFKKGEYQKNYHDPSDDWGLCGGVLRCNADGTGLEIVSRGHRNPWDITFDDEFNWLGTDNDQTHGDKIFSSFFGAHHGWGHPWSYDWKGDDHLPSAPSNGPLFEGSGTGVIYSGLANYPDRYRGVFLINDWLRRTVYIYRPTWKGAWMLPAKDKFDILAHAGGGRAMGQSSGRRFDPVDIELGPDGAIYIGSWGREYGLTLKNGKVANEGRIYRLWPKSIKPDLKIAARYSKSIKRWRTKELVENLGSHLPVWRANAQEELVRRGRGVAKAVRAAINEPRNKAAETWAAWTYGRMEQKDSSIDTFFGECVSKHDSQNLRIQSLRILGERARWKNASSLPSSVRAALTDKDARIRHEAVLAIRRAKNREWINELIRLAATESDRIVYYSAWGAMNELMSGSERKELLNSGEASVRRAALLSLLEEDLLTRSELGSMKNDADPTNVALVNKRLGGKDRGIIKGAGLSRGSGRATGPEAPVGPAIKPLSVVTSIKPESGLRYVEATLQGGIRAYTDRSYRVKRFSPALGGMTFIRSANNDADSGLLTINLRYPSKVYLADDVRGDQLPTWAKAKFKKTDLMLQTDDATHLIYEADFPAGSVTFGSNKDGITSAKSHYLLIIEPTLMAPPEKPTTVEEVLPLVANADVQHGRNLFLGATGALCVNCHQMEERGNVFAPDLAGIGKRAKAEFIIQSILEPSAQITEGFAAQVVTTRAGEEYEGILLEETGQGIKLAVGTGTVETIPKSALRSRKHAKNSAMPAIFAGILKPADVAAITAYLLQTSQ